MIWEKHRLLSTEMTTQPCKATVRRRGAGLSNHCILTVCKGAIEFSEQRKKQYAMDKVCLQ